MSYDIYTGILKMNTAFNSASEGIVLTYEFTNDALSEIKEKYLLEHIAGQGSDLSKVINMLHWVSENIYHNGSRPSPEPMNASVLLAHAFQKGEVYGINCRAQSIILTECLLALGIFARTIYIMPYSPYDGDNHVVTHAYISELEKWIMVDPTFNSYVMDDKKNILDIFEVREFLANQQEIFFNEEMNYNGSQHSAEAYQEYLAKDLFYFTTHEKSCFEAEQNSRAITICPKNYDVKNGIVSNIEYRIKRYGDNADMQNWLACAKKESLLFASKEDVLKVPKY